MEGVFNLVSSAEFDPSFYEMEHGSFDAGAYLMALDGIVGADRCEEDTQYGPHYHDVWCAKFRIIAHVETAFNRAASEDTLARSVEHYDTCAGKDRYAFFPLYRSTLEPFVVQEWAMWLLCVNQRIVISTDDRQRILEVFQHRVFKAYLEEDPVDSSMGHYRYGLARYYRDLNDAEKRVKDTYEGAHI